MAIIACYPHTVQTGRFDRFAASLFFEEWKSSRERDSFEEQSEKTKMGNRKFVRETTMGRHHPEQPYDREKIFTAKRIDEPQVCFPRFGL